MKNMVRLDRMTRQRRRRRRVIQRWAMLISSVIVVVFSIIAIAAVLNGQVLKAKKTPSHTITTKNTSLATTEQSTTATSKLTTATSTSSSTSATQQTTSSTVPQAVLGETVPPAPEVEQSYFDDAVFIGNSRSEGFKLYAGVNNASYLVYKGLNVRTILTKEIIEIDGQKLTAIQALEKKKYGKIYIMLGINELGWPYENVFIEEYGTIIDKIKNLQPDAVIYVQSIFPVSAARDAKGDSVNNKRILTYNELIKKMVREKGVYYLNVAEALQNEAGVLPPEASNDGVHLKAAYCKNNWLSYLKTHTIPS